jgi:hypothetical protein
MTHLGDLNQIDWDDLTSQVLEGAEGEG